MIDGPVPWILLALSAVILVCLVARRWSGRQVIGTVIAALAGAAIAASAVLVADETDAFGMRLPTFVLFTSIAAFAAVGVAVASLWAPGWWRKILAVLGVVVFAATGAILVNAQFGINPTLGSIFGIEPDENTPLPHTDGTAAPAPKQPLYETWTPPPGMPATGTIGSRVIPATISGFDARPAGIYLPPAALVDNPPALPVILFMMGQPGNPDASYIGKALDEYAAKNRGLAPIAVVADQVGTADVDTACADSKAYGNAMTYITKDVVSWMKANLHIIDDARYWAIGGYSNGGSCAITLAAKHPDMWKNVMDVSGEPFPGSEEIDAVIADVYNGDQAAFEASKPVAILAAHPGEYSGMTAAFTAGGGDPAYMAAAEMVSAAAREAGMTVSYDVIPGAGHVGDAVTVGMQITVGKMFPALGLTAP
ncbi:alpha/beta hydrolase [Microbacterium flavum]|uniref:alpha/beta hydrolase n=1 Tax=Microbacterium flavum TaxID=415216 RepID=UPI0027E0AA76|nr:alpha/beta hydrolase-fold protein [Microbacterium flavum]